MKGLPASAYDRPKRFRERHCAPERATRWAAHGAAVFISAVFLDSLRFKFTDAPKTQLIFSELDAWATSVGAGGVFAKGGVFSQYVIGGAELAAAAILLATMVAARYRFLQPAGALLAIAIMSGAIGFHLFTPLGIDVADDKGALFYAACATWTCGWLLLLIRRSELAELRRRLAAFFAPSHNR